MAQEDYLSGSPFAQVAGTLLSKKKDDDKDDAIKAILVAAIAESFGQLQQKQKLDIKDAADDINIKYRDIFEQNSEEWNGAANNRNRLKQYDQRGEGYLNSETASIINATPELFDKGVVWENRFDYDEEVFNKLTGLFDVEKDKLKKELELLRKDPVNTMRTKSEYNKAAENEYLAALAQVEDDPYKKGLIRGAFNKLFGFGAKERAELNNALQNAEKERTKFRSDISTARQLIDKHYESVVGSTSQGLLDGLSVRAKKAFTAEQVLKQFNENLKVLKDRQGADNENFFRIPLNIEILNSKDTIDNIDSIPERTEENTEVINIKSDMFKNIKTLKKEGDDVVVDPISGPTFLNALAVQVLEMNSQKIKNGIQPSIKTKAIHEAIGLWAEEGRFIKMNQLDVGGWGIGNLKFGGETLWNADDILFIPPGADFVMNNKSTGSDAAHENNNQAPANISDEINLGGEQEQGFNAENILLYATGDEFLGLDSIKQQNAINELKRVYKNKTQTIDLIFAPVLEDIKNQKQEKVKTAPVVDESDIDQYIKQKESEITKQAMSDLSSWYQSKQGQYDLERLEKLANDEGPVRGKKSLLKRFGLEEDASAEEIQIVLANLKQSNTSLLAKQ